MYEVTNEATFRAHTDCFLQALHKTALYQSKCKPLSVYTNKEINISIAISNHYHLLKIGSRLRSLNLCAINKTSSTVCLFLLSVRKFA